MSSKAPFRRGMLGRSCSIEEKPVFFMIGCQRSGSNWLRTMLDQRDELVGPHPPHIMREFMPIIDKFGNLSDDGNFRILLDHVCTFVERNQVQWTDKHGLGILFRRETIHMRAVTSCNRLLQRREEENSVANDDSLENELYLLSIFDAIMEFYTEANGKEIWMCKSMGMSAYHKYLLQFYGKKRLRYIYLVRDPRDVAMSFMKTPVGDCHWYQITKKWCKLQDQALHVLGDTPELIVKVHYEDILENQEKELDRIHEFIGPRRFNMMKMQSSIRKLDSTTELNSNAKHGRESTMAKGLSYQFTNLGRGKSFVEGQRQKWRDPESGMKEEELKIVESVAWKLMDHFGYITAFVGKSMEPIEFTQSDIEEFTRLNTEGIVKMNETLKVQNIGDYNRRQFQAEVLSFEPKLLTDKKMWDAPVAMDKESIMLRQIAKHDVCQQSTKSASLNGRIVLSCGAASQKGYYPGDEWKKNQDSFDIRVDGKSHFLACYDGHGTDGGECSNIVKSKLGELFLDFSKSMSVKKSLQKAHAETQSILTSSPSLDAQFSGTTSVAAVLNADRLSVCHVGDSVAMIGSKTKHRVPSLITKPHSLFRTKECKRIKKSGGFIMSVEEYNELKQKRPNLSKADLSLDTKSNTTRSLKKWMKKRFTFLKPYDTDSLNSDASAATAPESIEMPRVWYGDNLEHSCNFSRSLGDTLAHSVGISARPDYTELRVKNGDVIILASDGVTEYLDVQSCIDIVYETDDPSKAANMLVRRATECWAKQNDYVDDITAVVIFIQANAKKT